MGATATAGVAAGLTAARRLATGGKGGKLLGQVFAAALRALRRLRGAAHEQLDVALTIRAMVFVNRHNRAN